MKDRAFATLKSTYRHSMFRYIVIGGTTFALDLLILIVLKSVWHLNVLVAATFSYWISLLYNFVLNRLWSFKAAGGNIRRHVAFYTVLVIINYAVSLLLITALAPLGVNYAVAKTIAVIISTAWNYLVYKHIVFAKPHETLADHSNL